MMSVMTLQEYERFLLERRRRGVGQREVAERAGVTQAELSRWERGQRTWTPERVERVWATIR